MAYNNNNNNNNNNGGNKNSNSHYSCIAVGTIKGRLAADPTPVYEQEKNRTKFTARILVNQKGQELADSWNITEYKDDKAEYPSANFRALAEFLKKGRFVTITGQIRQNSRKNDKGEYTNFMEIKAFPGSIVMDSAGSSDNEQQTGQPQGNFGGQPQGNFGGQPQGNFGGQSQNQGNFGGQPQGNFGGQSQGNFGGQSQNQGNFGGQPQGNFGAPAGNFGAPTGNFGGPTGNFGGAPTGNFGQ